MGVALAEEARRRGGHVLLLAANLAVDPPAGVELVATPSAGAMLAAAESAEFDLALLAAAVADYRPVAALATKRPKAAEAWTLELEPTVDIARTLGARKRDGQVLVAFGAELGEEGLERKRTMLDEKNADLVVFNDVSRPDIGFDSAENEVVLITRDGDRLVARASKEAVAAAILDEAERLLAVSRIQETRP
jgi:phosphopantothenoylcysteine decarboxylase/phosphopantothenate--cysteine ligase